MPILIRLLRRVSLYLSRRQSPAGLMRFDYRLQKADIQRAGVVDGSDI